MKMYILAHDTARSSAVQAVKDAPAGYCVRIDAPTRNLCQNSKLHALFSDVAKESEYLGRKLTADQWKNLFISGHAIATGRGVDMVPGLEGEFLNIRESSARMTVARMTSLIEYVLAWHAMNEAAA